MIIEVYCEKILVQMKTISVWIVHITMKYIKIFLLLKNVYNIFWCNFKLFDEFIYTLFLLLVCRFGLIFFFLAVFYKLVIINRLSLMLHYFHLFFFYLKIPCNVNMYNCDLLIKRVNINQHSTWRLHLYYRVMWLLLNYCHVISCWSKTHMRLPNLHISKKKNK